MTSGHFSAVVRSVSDFPSECPHQLDWCAMSVWGCFLVILVFHVFISWEPRDHHSHNIGQIPAVAVEHTGSHAAEQNIISQELTIKYISNQIVNTTRAFQRVCEISLSCILFIFLPQNIEGGVVCVCTRGCFYCCGLKYGMLSMSNVYLIYMFARSRTEAERGVIML